MSAERRIAPRNLVFRMGELSFDPASGNTDCLVRDSSETGALIEVLTTEAIPDRFDLIVYRQGVGRACRVVRRTKHMLGVAFVP